MLIVQISDLHLDETRGSLNGERAINYIVDRATSLRREKETLVIAVPGDLTTKGREHGYVLSKTFLLSLRSKLPDDARFLICPGNHDVALERELRYRFAWYYTYIHGFSVCDKRSSDSRMFIATIDDVCFLVLNTADRNDDSYGRAADCEIARGLLDDCHAEHRAMLLHHHLIPFEKDKQSALRNASELIELLQHRGFSLVMHGHQHINSILRVGISGCPLVGSGSLFALPDANTNNQFVTLRYAEGQVTDVLTHRYNEDAHRGGRAATFVESEVEGSNATG